MQQIDLGASNRFVERIRDFSTHLLHRECFCGHAGCCARTELDSYKESEYQDCWVNCLFHGLRVYVDLTTVLRNCRRQAITLTTWLGEGAADQGLQEGIPFEMAMQRESSRCKSMTYWGWKANPFLRAIGIPPAEASFGIPPYLV